MVARPLLIMGLMGLASNLMVRAEPYEYMVGQAGRNGR